MTVYDELRTRVKDAIQHYHYYVNIPTKSAISLLDEVQNMHAYLDSETEYHHADLVKAAQIEQERNEWKERSKNADARVRRWRNALVDLLDSLEEIE